MYSYNPLQGRGRCAHARVESRLVRKIYGQDLALKLFQLHADMGIPMLLKCAEVFDVRELATLPIEE